MYVCMYVYWDSMYVGHNVICMYVCTYVCVYVCMYLLCMYVWDSMYVCMYHIYPN